MSAVRYGSLYYDHCVRVPLLFGLVIHVWLVWVLFSRHRRDTASAITESAYLLSSCMWAHFAGSPLSAVEVVAS